MARALGDAEQHTVEPRMGLDGLLQERVQFLVGLPTAHHKEEERGRGDADGGQL